MKPLNLDNSPCSPISSNCVIWQGPDLACIKLCKGDTVSNVVAKLATELCTILDQLNVDNYDLTCFNSSACPPVDFQALIQFLINHICALEGVTPNTNPSTSTCPDCVVSIAPCFVIGAQTTMQLTDYVQMIGERVCNLITNITGLQLQINNIDSRVTVLENTPNTIFTLPSIIVNCTLSPTVLGGSAYPIDTVLNALINDSSNGYCSLIGATGIGADLFSAVSSQCITSSSPTLSNAPTPFGTEYLGSWIGTPTTVADSITNLWIVLCDIYTYLTKSASTTVVAAGENVSVTSNTVGTTTTYTVNSLGLNSFVAEMTINSSYQPLNGSIPVVDPSMVTGLAQGQIINRYNYIVSNNTVVQAIPSPGSYVTNGSLPACSFGTFDNDTTGQFTITETGMYLVQGSCHLKSNNTSSEFWHTGVPGDTSGSFGVGLLLPGSNILGGQYQATLIRVNKEVDICSDVLTYLTAGTVLRLSLLNLTNRNYNGNTYTSSDTIKFSITQIRSL
jgi:hypothetical protein